MHLKARLAGFNVDREKIRLILSSFDPERVEMRAAHKLHRRYMSKESFEVWHIDGCGKLKPFEIH